MSIIAFNILIILLFKRFINFVKINSFLSIVIMKINKKLNLLKLIILSILIFRHLILIFRKDFIAILNSLSLILNKKKISLLLVLKILILSNCLEEELMVVFI
jgi:hypothetical protein